MPVLRRSTAMYSDAAARSPTTRTRSLTGRPQSRSRSYQPDWAGRAASPGRPSTRPTPCTSRSSARDAVTFGSFCRSEPGRGVARVGERRLARLGQPLVQLLERGDRQEHLAAHLEHVRHSRCRTAGAGTAAMVRMFGVTSSPVVPSPRVAARTSAPLAVDQVHRQPVDLELAQVRPGSAEPLHPRRPGVELLGRERVVQRRAAAPGARTGVNSVEMPAHLLGRRVRRAQVRVLAPPARAAPASARRSSASSTIGESSTW